VSGGKKITDSAITGDTGIALIHTIVGRMRHVWREWNGSLDAGIDGSIELRDPLSGEVTNKHVLVQSKAWTVPFPGEDDTKFHFVCDDRDIDYWMKADDPVVLICSHPATSEAWWVHVQPWFADHGHRASRRVDFNKATDAFTAVTSSRLLALADPHGRAHTPTPVTINESLISNLLPVELPDVYYSAPTSLHKRGAVYAAQRKSERPLREDFVLANNRIYSWRPMSGTSLALVPDAAANADPVGELARSDANSRRLLVNLLNVALQEDLGPDLCWNKDRKFIYYRATTDLSQRKVRSTTGRSRTVFKQYLNKKDPTQVAYYRHAALRWRFVDFDGDWYCAITPDYFFTYDGQRESKFADDYLRKIKQIDRNQAVLGETRAWAAIFRNPETLLGAEDRILDFGDLIEFKVDRGIDDADWKPVSAPDVDSSYSTLFDEVDDTL
jgi:hypothetical protein